ncbi:hypothetical protein M3Y99_01632500 [Aphelenchoides fujianensis]|nr:hypothetical protein M3Y99_01632500 [Aphelenchoides fujianensis]
MPELALISHPALKHVEDWETTRVEEIVDGIDPTIERAVRKLKEAGFKVGLFCNNGFWTEARKRSMIPEDLRLFDAVVESCRIGLRKSDPESYHVAARAIGCRPAECVLVDDSRLNVEGAEREGHGRHSSERERTARRLSLNWSACSAMSVGPKYWRRWRPLEYSPPPVRPPLKRRKLSSTDPDQKQDEHAFVYDAPDLGKSIRCSPDGRYVYTFVDGVNLVIVDLYRSMQKVMKPDRSWQGNPEDFVVVDPNTILFVAKTRRCVRGFLGLHRALYRLRFADNGKCYQWMSVPYAGESLSPTIVFSQITGQRVDVKQEKLGSIGDPSFWHVDVDEPRAVQQGNEIRLPANARFVGRLSENGRKFYAMGEDPKVLYVYWTDEKMWTDAVLNTDAMQSNFVIDKCFWTANTLYAKVDPKEHSPKDFLLFRCDLKRKRWEEMTVDAEDLEHIFPLVNSKSGEEDGILLVYSKTHPGPSRDLSDSRYKFQRVMLRNVDSLRVMSLMAVHRSREEIEGEEGFHQKMNVAPQKNVLKSRYQGMRPIVVRRLE